MPKVEPHPSSESQNSATGAHRQPLVDFLTFAAEALGIEHRHDDGRLELGFEHREHPTWPRPYRVRIAVTDEAMRESARRQLMPSGGAAWVWALAQRQSGALMGRPAHQPEAVHEFSSRLFNAYQVDGGQTHLAGCRLTDVPFLRITRLDANDPTQVEHEFRTAEGKRVEEQLLTDLGLGEIHPLGTHPTCFTPDEAAELLQGVDTSSQQFLAATIVCAKWAEGALQFDINDQSARVEFAGWTSTLTAPPFHCAASHTDTYHLAALDDGRIVAAEAIDVCQESGARILAAEMVTCSVTGKRIDPALATKCTVTGEQTLNTEFADCAICGQAVSRTAIVDQVCQACRDLPRLASSDPLVTSATEQYPALKKYFKFRGRCDGQITRLMAIGVWQRLMVVLEGQDVIHVSRRRRFSAQWTPLPELPEHESTA